MCIAAIVNVFCKPASLGSIDKRTKDDEFRSRDHVDEVPQLGVERDLKE